jgi:hypothetical protein
VLRVPLDSYVSAGETRVYSLVAAVPFSPIDVDIGHLARGEWNPMTDRFRIWFLPGEDGTKGKPLCYVMMRKLDMNDLVLVYAHVVVNIDAKVRDVYEGNFTVGILSNDDVRARAALNAMLEIPPSFHRRNEIRLVERKWRSDSGAVMRFAANVHSAMALPAGKGAVYQMKVESPAGFIADMKRNLGEWWK